MRYGMILFALAFVWLSTTAAAHAQSAQPPAAAQPPSEPTVCTSDPDVQKKFAACDHILATYATLTPIQRGMILRERARANVGATRYDAGLADYTQAITLNPNDATAYYRRGLLYRSFQRHAAAVDDFDKAVTLGKAVTGGDLDARTKLITQIEGYLREERADKAVDQHWANYLKTIQDKKTYPNWTAPPYDMYLKAANGPLAPPKG